LILASVVGVFLLASPWASLATEPPLHAERTFYGTYRVTTAPGTSYRSLKMGTTLHGLQDVSPEHRREALSYYHRTGPFGLLFASVPHLREPGAIAAIGLGVGTLSSYAQPGQQWTFYEIDPAVERIARDERYFTYLQQCGDQCQVVIGDARLSLASRADARYQLIVLDAFSSDAIPMHLLTQEAMALYLSRLAPHGVMAFHISNRHLNLAPIVGRLAVNNGLTVIPIHDAPSMRRQWASGKAQSTWMMMARVPAELGELTRDPQSAKPWVPAATPLWTDDFSNIFDVLDLGLF
jgi:spermidine synthase